MGLCGGFGEVEERHCAIGVEERVRGVVIYTLKVELAILSVSTW